MIYYYFLFLFRLSFALGFSNVAFIIISQDNQFNLEFALNLQETIKVQSRELNLFKTKVFVSPADFPDISGQWTLFPLLTPVLDAAEDSQWVVFLEDSCNISLTSLYSTLESYNSDEEIWLASALFDNEATIIHHFGFYKDPTFFKYPNLGSGIVFSSPLLKRVQSELMDGEYKLPDFHIDPGYELALFVYKNGEGPMIYNETTLCLKKGHNCAIYPKKINSCGESNVDSIYFAVKTCEKFHKDRVKVVMETWGQFTTNINFFSDIEDLTIPTISVGVENTKQGHCEKTMMILKYIVKELKTNSEMKWVALVDDDTILSVSRLANLVTCYNTKEPIILGERYRFGGSEGFDYATGGAGTILNRAAIELLSTSCRCPRIDAPDDMVMGSCTETLNISLVHIPQMHQARPSDYANGRLANADAVTFHKHWMINPVNVYREWFESDDRKLQKHEMNKSEL